MDTIYAEGQRRYVESLSAYARQFVSQMQKPVVDHIDGLSPAIAIEQKNLGHTPRSTVGTVTEIYDYLRILLARIGQPHCPTCDRPIGTQTVDEIVDKLLSEPEGTRLYLLAPVDIEVGQTYEPRWQEFRKAGFARVRVDGHTYDLDSPPDIDRRRKHRVEVVIDRIVVDHRARARIADSIETTLSFGKGVMHVAYVQEEVPEPRWPLSVHSQHLACADCGRSFEPLTPHCFSFNSPLGWCPACEGLGVQRGANPAALLEDPKRTLSEGAVQLWPKLTQAVSRAMLAAFGRGTNIPLEVPFSELDARQRRLILHGTGDQWFEVSGESIAAAAGSSASPGKTSVSSGRGAAGGAPAGFRFQFKGLYPAIEEASRLSPSFRARLEEFVDEVECATCSGSRLRDDASAVRFRGRTIDDLCRLPLGKLQEVIEGWKLTCANGKSPES